MVAATREGLGELHRLAASPHVRSERHRTEDHLATKT